MNFVSNVSSILILYDNGSAKSQKGGENKTLFQVVKTVETTNMATLVMFLFMLTLLIVDVKFIALSLTSNQVTNS